MKQLIYLTTFAAIIQAGELEAAHLGTDMQVAMSATQRANDSDDLPDVSLGSVSASASVTGSAPYTGNVSASSTVEFYQSGPTTRAFRWRQTMNGTRDETSQGNPYVSVTSAADFYGRIDLLTPEAQSLLGQPGTYQHVFHVSTTATAFYTGDNYAQGAATSQVGVLGGSGSMYWTVSDPAPGPLPDLWAEGSLTVNEVVVFDPVGFTFGQDFNVNMNVGLAGGTPRAGGTANYTMDNRVTWLGIRVFDNNGNLITPHEDFRLLDVSNSEAHIPVSMVGEELPPPPIEGDIDGDGFVGIDDLNMILADWNQTVPPADPWADVSGDGFIGIDDLNAVLGNWNAGTPPIGTTNIPEPATVLVMGLGAAVALARHHRSALNGVIIKCVG